MTKQVFKLTCAGNEMTKETILVASDIVKASNMALKLYSYGEIVSIEILHHLAYLED